MGRLTLNMLLSFAQFEREVTAERIRDKIAASKRKGLWMGGTVPFGYRADGRSLAIDEAEAPVIRHIYALYLDFGSVREVAERATELGYRTRLRTFTTGRSSGGTPFTRGHVWHILANPLYAGRIRHRDKVHDGQHPAIFAPELWKQVQDRLTGDANRDRGKSNASVISPLAGKLFDETGDRLTPSHTQKNGKRLRYYISRRLVTDRRRNHADAWRLPAREIETGIAAVLRRYLMKPAVVTELINEVKASEICGLQARLQHIALDCDPDRGAELWAPLLRRADLGQGRILLRVNRKLLAERLGIKTERISLQGRLIAAPFKMQRRGVETKIILGTATPRTDPVLVKNMLTARRWYEAIRKGAAFSVVAGREKTTTSRIQQMIGLAFLAPEILDRIAAGTQPIAFTSEWFKIRQLPTDWDDQHGIIAAL